LEITSDDTLRKQAGLSLRDRAELFKDRYPEYRMNASALGKLYADHNIKKRAIMWKKKKNPLKSKEYKSKVSALHAEVQGMMARGFKIIYIDETMFTRRARMNSEYANMGSNIQIIEKELDAPTLAFLVGISAEDGVESPMIFNKSVNRDKFIEFLQILRTKNKKKDICIFMDNLQVHKMKVV